MAKYTAWILVVTFYLLCLKGSAQDFDLADALDDKPTKPPTVKPNPKVPGGSSDFDFDFDFPAKKTTTKAPKVTTTTTKAPPKPKPKQDLNRKGYGDPIVRPGLRPGPHTATKQPRTPRPPSKGKAASDDLNLADALDENNDIGGKDQNKNGDKGVIPGSRGDDGPTGGDKKGGTFTDEDLEDISKGGGYSPDKKPDRGRGSASSDDTNYDSTAETGTIAGIASALAMALIGAVSSYISYQQKKFCFSIQEGLNAEYVKGDTLEAVVAQEPQVQQTLLQSPSSEPPAQDSNKV
ncbi:CD99 antigen-like protein 2 isoform X1 [Lepisosteus oculatus]|uniref:CD99 antigen-like protein 2 isoform X1 n=1 Tax=Lepisosteus oculatus TaxID=7918 RepID=UPI0037146544